MRRYLTVIVLAVALTACHPTNPDGGCGHVYPNPCEQPELFHSVDR
jgi:hypothetical protein